ncbi:MAG: NAD(P)-binding domain-containing protein [Gemmatimonadaceae bacterium]|nr:NAD(P)-binding domain-containing protein [Chitinophagaceae bacterium]
MTFAVIGSGSWATALAKILTDNKAAINWWVRSAEIADHILARHHNPRYLSTAYFDTSLLKIHTDLAEAVKSSDAIIIAMPSAYIAESFAALGPDAFKGKQIISAVKGILPAHHLLLNDYLKKEYDFDLNDYYTIMGPCHAEEVAAEKLSYLTFSGLDEEKADNIAMAFDSYYLKTIVNHDVYGVQYAAILKNIYALGAGIAHGLEYGDNFQSVLIANCADEMAGFLRKVGISNIDVGIHGTDNPLSKRKSANYAASVYLGDLLVTCYSLYSRNRSFGNMIGKGYSVRTAQLEMNMVAEGYNASRSIFEINKEIRADMPIAETIYQILWEKLPPAKGFKSIEETLI